MAATVSIDARPGHYTQFGYETARKVLRDGVTASPGSGDLHARWDRIKLANQSRYFWRNNGLYSGMISRAVDYLIGRGFTLQARTDDPSWNATAEKLWRSGWTNGTPDYRRMLSGVEVERMAARELLRMGEVASLETASGCQLIESEQIVGPNMQDPGLIFGPDGPLREISIAGYSKHGMAIAAKSRRYAIEDVSFVADLDRPSSVRAVPPCQSAFPMLHRINDVCDSEAIAWQVLARLAVSIERDNAPSLGHAESTADPEASGDEALERRISELGYALIFHANKGESVKPIPRDIPGKDFPQSLRMFLRLLGLPLGLPLEFILLDWTQSNYSQSRAVFEQAFTAFLRWQGLLECGLYRRWYTHRVRQWIDDGLLAMRDDWDAHEWIRPTFPWLDRLKEAQAWGAQLDRGFASHQLACKSLNTERDEIVTAREAEVRDAIARAQSIQTDTGVAVPWQIFAGLVAPGQNSKEMAGAALGADPDPDPEPDQPPATQPQPEPEESLT